MNSNLWNDEHASSDSTDATVATATTDTSVEQSPLAAAIEASSWSRADIELALQAVQVALLAVWVYHTYHE